MDPIRRLKIAPEELAAICKAHKVRELSVFGSAVRKDFGPDSDVDLLVEFQADAHIGLMEFSRLQRELATLFGRRVDLVPKRGLKELVREPVLASAHVVYAA